jgi:hypothetical protein
MERPDSTPRLTAVIPVLPAGPDLDVTVNWYVGKLGFTQAWRDGGMAGIRRDGIDLMLMKFDDRKFAENYMFRLKVENIDALHEEFGKACVEKLGKLEMKPWGVYEFHVIDPAGVCIHFFK